MSKVILSNPLSLSSRPVKCLTLINQTSDVTQNGFNNQSEKSNAFQSQGNPRPIARSLTALSFPGTSSMAVTQWTVQIKRSACGSRLRSWCLTRAVHETGSMSELPNMPFFPDQRWTRGSLCNPVFSEALQINHDVLHFVLESFFTYLALFVKAQ